jgi:peptide-methionine (S)-S-oxide reductase
LGGGCFWCLEAVYQQIKGVSAVVSGYAGGEMLNPDYESICTGQTGHAEIVDVYFDPAVVSYRDLLEIFFVIHDPSTLNYQGNDHGTQYRSVIFTHSESQHIAAHEIIQELETSRIYSSPVVTQVDAAPVIAETVATPIVEEVKKAPAKKPAAKKAPADKKPAVKKAPAKKKPNMKIVK